MSIVRDTYFKTQLEWLRGPDSPRGWRAFAGAAAVFALPIRSVVLLPGEGLERCGLLTLRNRPRYLLVDAPSFARREQSSLGAALQDRVRVG